MISHTIKFKSKSILLNLYKTLVRPHVEYCTSVWSPHYIKGHEDGTRYEVFAIRK